MNKDNIASSSRLSLRPAVEADAPLLIFILHTAFEEYRDKLDPPAGVFHETSDTIRQKMQEGFFVLALIGDLPVGCVFYQSEVTHLYLGRLAVLPQYRKQGVARALVDYVERQAVTRQISRVQLGVRLALPNLVKYYARLGYHTIRYEAHPGYTQPTYAIMEKEIE